MHCRSVQGYFGRLEANSDDPRPNCRGLTKLTLKVDVISGAEQRQHRRYWCGNDYAIEISMSVPRGGMIVSSYELSGTADAVLR
jgi:hypothetical protein